MVNYDDFKNEVEQQMDELYGNGCALAEKYGSQPLATLTIDSEFITTLGYLFLECASTHNAAAMLASREVGIETTADPMRVMLAYLSDDESLIDAVTDKAEAIASTLSLQAWSGSI